jgi:hypothetical protein
LLTQGWSINRCSICNANSGPAVICVLALLFYSDNCASRSSQWVTGRHNFQKSQGSNLVPLLQPLMKLSALRKKIMTCRLIFRSHYQAHYWSRFLRSVVCNGTFPWHKYICVEVLYSSHIFL